MKGNGGLGGRGGDERVGEEEMKEEGDDEKKEER